MNLDLLMEIPEDEQSVLFIAEDHNMPVLEEMLEILHAYEPEAIGIEMRPTMVAYANIDLARSLALTFPPESTLEPGALSRAIRKPTATSVAVLYAAWKGIPTYFLDWQPSSPDCIADASSLSEGFSQGELASALRETLEDLFDMDLGLEDEDIDESVFNALLRSDHGMAMRNEYTATAVDARSEQRLLYIGGNEHFCDNLDLEQYTPLQDLVRRKHRYLARLTALDCTDEILEKVEGSREQKLPWERVKYMEARG